MAQTPKLTEASAILGIDQATLYRKRKKMGWGVKAKTLPAKSYTETMPQMWIKPESIFAGSFAGLREQCKSTCQMTGRIIWTVNNQVLLGFLLGTEIAGFHLTIIIYE